MKKLGIFTVAAIMLLAMVGMVSCGPSAAEKVRMDSIRVADSLRRIDSIKIADSLKVVREAEAQHQAYRKMVDETATGTKAAFVVKLYDVHRVVTASEGMMGSKKSITVIDVVSGKKDKMSLRNSEDFGSIVDITPGNKASQIIVKIHNGGSGPFYQLYYVDVENMELLKVEDA